MLFRVQHLERRQSLGDGFSRELIFAADNNGGYFRVLSIDHSLEPNLLEVEDDVLHTFDHARDGGEFLIHARDLDLTDSKTLQRGEKNATEGITDSLSVARLKRPELETANGIGTFEHDHLVRFLKC